MQIYNFLTSKGLEKRPVQEKFFNIVLSAIEEGKGSTKIIQAPTGTGKTYGYLIPLIEKGQKAIISTGTKLLQEQLRKDIETLRSYYAYLTGKEVSYLVLKGKSNYLCLDRYHDMPEGELPQELRDAVSSAWDGDFEFVNLNPELKERLCVEDDHCTPHYRHICRYRQECYYWDRIKRLERSADILVVNHALLSLKEFENPEERVLVIDEAHELDRYITSSLSQGISLYTLRVDIVGKIREFLQDADIDLEDFFSKRLGGLFKEDREEVPVDSLIDYLEGFEEEVLIPMEHYYKKIREELTQSVRSFVSSTLFVSMRFKDYLLKTGLIEWSQYLELKSNYEEPSSLEESFLKKLKSYEFLRRRLARVKEFYRLVKENPQNVGYIVGRRYSKRLQTYNYYLHLFPIFPAGLLDFSSYRALIVTSATVDPLDLAITVGIKGEYHRLEHTFPYHRVNFLVYRADPRKREDWEDCVRRAYKYLRSLYDKVLVLLTNKEHLKLFEREEGVAFQGDEGLSSLVAKLREGKIGVLIGLESLWFGVDVKGQKGILMSKLPFESPEDPLTYHRIRFLRSIGEEPFEYQKRKALIKFRQGIGRLMRSKEDGGTIVLCDSRVFRFREFLQALRELGISYRVV